MFWSQTFRPKYAKKQCIIFEKSCRRILSYKPWGRINTLCINTILSRNLDKNMLKCFIFGISWKNRSRVEAPTPNPRWSPAAGNFAPDPKLLFPLNLRYSLALRRYLDIVKIKITTYYIIFEIVSGHLSKASPLAQTSSYTTEYGWKCASLGIRIHIGLHIRYYYCNTFQ